MIKIETKTAGVQEEVVQDPVGKVQETMIQRAHSSLLREEVAYMLIFFPGKTYVNPRQGIIDYIATLANNMRVVEQKTPDVARRAAAYLEGRLAGIPVR